MLLAHALPRLSHLSPALPSVASSCHSSSLNSCSHATCVPVENLSTNPHNVDAIFSRAERVFEYRVEQLLHAKREKAVTTGNAFNARKAKRDARTVAGREKLDALVRRLADLATAQRMVLCTCGRRAVSSGLDGLAAAVLGIFALHVADESSQSHLRPVDLMESSSCSDDGVLANAREPSTSIRCTSKPDQVHDSRTKETFPDGRMFMATQSVVDFVLDCDDEKINDDIDLAFENDDVIGTDDVDDVVRPSALRNSYSCERFGKKRFNTSGLSGRPSHGSCASLSSLSSISSLYPGSYGSLTSLASSAPPTGMSAISGLGFKRTTTTQEVPNLHRRSLDEHRPRGLQDSSRHHPRHHHRQRYRHGPRHSRDHRFEVSPEGDVYERVEQSRTRHAVARQPTERQYGLVDGVVRNVPPGRGDGTEAWMRYTSARSADDVWHGSRRGSREPIVARQSTSETIQTGMNEGRWCAY